tara:strand:- start:1019 stop:1927 length:909 start_codon:yes stop_codon:yes gene_type:complete
MAQADGIVSNGSGAAVRADLNNQLAALFTTHSGATTPSTTYAYQFWADTTANELKIRNSANSAWISLRGLDGSFTVPDGSVGTPGLRFSSDTNTGLYRSEADTIAFSTGGTYRLLIGGSLSTDDGGPSLLWKTTSNPVENNVTGVQFPDGGRINIGNFAQCLVLNRHTSTGSIVGIRYNTTSVGSISVTASATAYNTSSDYRLKENVIPLTGAKARVNDLDVKRFNFIATPSATVDGFLAHEVQSVVPEAVTGQHNETDLNGDPVYQEIDQSKLVPLLTAALQEAFAEIAALTTRVETLEAG